MASAPKAVTVGVPEERLEARPLPTRDASSAPAALQD
jgi:hypothetical protein